MGENLDQERKPMEVFVTNQPYMLYETVELLRAFVNETDPEELTMEGEFCLAPQEVRDVMAAACQGVDPEDKWVRHFFLEYPILDDSDQSTCLASCIAYSIFNISMKETTLEQQLAFVVNQWNVYRRTGYHISAVDRFGIDIDLMPTQEPVRLSDELKRLPLSSDFYFLVHEAFSDLDFSAAQLLRVIRPVAERLLALLRPYVRRAAALAERWSHFFQNREMLYELLRSRAGVVEEDFIDRVYLVLRYLHSRYVTLIKLEEWDREKEYDRLGLEEEYTEFLGNQVVCHSLPIRPGRNLAVIVEAAAVNHRQKKMGYNAAKELYNRVQNSIMKNAGKQKEE